MGLQPRFSSPEEYQAYKKELERRLEKRLGKRPNRPRKRKKIAFYVGEK